MTIFSFIKHLYIGPLSKLRFCRFSGSFEPLFDSNWRGNINYVYGPSNLNQKAAKIIPKNDEPLISKEVCF